MANDIETKEILSLYCADNYVNIEVLIHTETSEETIQISIEMYEFIQWFTTETIKDIKNKLIETIQNK